MPVEIQRMEPRGTDAPMAMRVQVRDHVFTADASVAEGSLDAGPSPHDLYDAALGACKALTMLWYARRKGIPVDDIRTVVERDDSQERQGTYKLAARLEVSGALTDAQLAELATVAGKCPVHKLMTQVTTEITTDVRRLS